MPLGCGLLVLVRVWSIPFPVGAIRVWLDCADVPVVVESQQMLSPDRFGNRHVLSSMCADQSKVVEASSGGLLAFKRELQLLDVKGEIQGNLNRVFVLVFAVVDIHIGFELETVADDLLPSLSERLDEM